MYMLSVTLCVYLCNLLMSWGGNFKAVFTLIPWQGNFRRVTKGQLVFSDLFQGSLSLGKVTQASSAGVATLARVVMAFARNVL